MSVFSLAVKVKYDVAEWSEWLFFFYSLLSASEFMKALLYGIIQSFWNACLKTPNRYCYTHTFGSICYTCGNDLYTVAHWIFMSSGEKSLFPMWFTHPQVVYTRIFSRTLYHTVRSRLVHSIWPIENFCFLCT